MAQELLKTLLKTSQFEGIEEVPWSEVQPNEKKTLIVNGEFDVDFICLYGKCHKFFAEGTVQRLFSHYTGAFVRPYIMRLQGSSVGAVLVLLDVKPFKIGISLVEHRTLCEETEGIYDDSTPKSLNKRHQKLVIEVQKKVENLQGKTFPFRDFKTEICKYFSDFDIACFQFGQKQPFDSCLEMLKDLSSEIQLDLAIGFESTIEGKYICASSEGANIGECFYPMFLSQIAGSLLLNEKHAARTMFGSRRMVCYSTLHHMRKFEKFQLNLKNNLEESVEVYDRRGDTTKAADEFEYFLRVKILERITELAAKVHPLVEKSKLRVESYFSIEVNQKGNVC
jgi:hypothetical protein